jgi:hypothetical protein
MECLKILLLSLVSTVTYGILHDQVTARLCVEYFTIGHPPIFYTQNATLLAFGWGILATWWMGLLLGLPLALTAALGSRPKLTAGRLVRPLVISMCCVALIATGAGMIGFLAAKKGMFQQGVPLAVPPEKHALFLADAWAHGAAYAAGALAGIILWTWAGKKRDQLQRQLHSNSLLTDSLK